MFEDIHSDITSVSSVSEIDGSISSRRPNISGMLSAHNGLPDEQFRNGRPLPQGREDGVVFHPLYHMNDPMVTVQVENTVYRVPAYGLLQSNHWQSQLIAQNTSNPVDGKTNIIFLDVPNITSLDFERLLCVLYPICAGKYAIGSVEEWTSVLHLSTIWQLHFAHELAMRELLMLASAVERLVLGRRFSLDQWVLEAVLELCARPSKLTLDEGMRLSQDDAMRIGRVRNLLRGAGEESGQRVQEVVRSIFNLQVAANSSRMLSDNSVAYTSEAVVIQNGELTVTTDQTIDRVNILYMGIVEGSALQKTYVPAGGSERYTWVHNKPVKENKVNRQEILSGIFSTEDIRDWMNVAHENTKRIMLEPPYPSGQQPKIILGLSMLDIDRCENIRVRCTVEYQHPSSAHLFFRGQIESWYNTRLYAAAVNWLDIPPNLGFQFGHTALQKSGDPGSVRDSSDKPIKLSQVSFNPPYSSPPTVVVWLTGLDFDKGRNYRVRLDAMHVDRTGFALDAATWDNTILHGVGASWIAIPENARGIFVGTYNMDRDHQSGSVVFPRPFHSVPKVVVGLNKLDFDCRTNLRVHAFVHDVTKHGFTWDIQTWKDTIMYAASITVIALESGPPGVVATI